MEVAHEALLREWPRLRGWLDESRDDIRLQRRLAQQAGEWQDNGEDESFLLRGARLEQFAGWAADSKLQLTPEEQRFLDTSLAMRAARAAEEEARRQRELATAQQLAETERRRALEAAAATSGLRRRALLLAGVALLAVAAAATAFVFARQSGRNLAQAEDNLALAQTREAEANLAQIKAQNEPARATAGGAVHAIPNWRVNRGCCRSPAMEQAKPIEQQRAEKDRR